jgi:hypothetical protein
MPERREDEERKKDEPLSEQDKRMSHLFPGLKKLPTKGIPKEAPREEQKSETTAGGEKTKSHDPFRRAPTISLPKISYEGVLKMRYTCACGVPHDIEAKAEQFIEKSVFCDVCGRKYVLRAAVGLEPQK